MAPFGARTAGSDLPTLDADPMAGQSMTNAARVTLQRLDGILSDNADAIQIGRRSLFIARQSVLAGIGLSLVAMGVAAAGYLPPVEGALLQEGIDVGVILNALRALRG